MRGTFFRGPKSVILKAPMTPGYENLIDTLIRDGYLKTQEYIEAFKVIDRADFVLEEDKESAYVNAPLSIGFNQTISQPLTVAFMIELLGPRPREKILEIGAGSGWQTAILAEIISEQGADARSDENEDKASSSSTIIRGPLVVAIERIEELKQMAERNVEKYGYMSKGIVRIVKADGSKGYRKAAPYDRIIAGAASAGAIPEAWRKQLKIGGRIVSPVGQSIVVIDKLSKTEYAQKEYFGFSFVPLIKE